MMGFDPMSLKYIRLAHEDGLGVGDTNEIEIVGDDISAERWNFSVGDNGASRVGDIMWFGPLKASRTSSSTRRWSTSLSWGRKPTTTTIAGR